MPHAALGEVVVTLLGSGMEPVMNVIVLWDRARPMPDTIVWQERVFRRERVRDPHGARRWHYVEVTAFVVTEAAVPAASESDKEDRVG